MGNPFSSPSTDAGRTEDREESGRWPFASHDDSDGLPLISIVTPRRRLQNCLVSLVFQTITIMADVGLPLVSRRSPQRGDRSRPPPIFTEGPFNVIRGQVLSRKC